MPHLLHIDSSVLGEQSVSRRLTARAAERWHAAHPGGTVIYRDLATDPIPHLDAETGAARRLPAELRTPAHQASFAVSAALIDENKRADTVLLGLPLYNYGPPSAVNAWIDHIVAPGLSTDPETGTGLVGDTDFIVLASRGGGVRTRPSPRRLGSQRDLAAPRRGADWSAAAIHHRRTHRHRSQSRAGRVEAAGRGKLANALNAINQRWSAAALGLQ
jgi:FMN-dependent NADH-azoreductase